MSKLDPEDPNFMKKMHQYNKRFRDYVSEFTRNGQYTKDQVLDMCVAREVALFYLSNDNTQEPEVTANTTINCGC